MDQAGYFVLTISGSFFIQTFLIPHFKNLFNVLVYFTMATLIPALRLTISQKFNNSPTSYNGSLSKCDQRGKHISILMFMIPISFIRIISKPGNAISPWIELVFLQLRTYYSCKENEELNDINV